MKPGFLGVVSAAVLLAGVAQAQPQIQKIAGEVVKLDGARLEVKASSGQVVEVKLAENVRLGALSSADATKLSPGAFIATTAVPQPDGTLLAREVRIFPESMRGRGEGHRAMDNEPGSTMTNATIASVGGSDAAARNTMTNATVAAASDAPGSRRLTLTYKGGEKTVVVPQNVPVAMVEPADRSLLLPGAHVIVYASPGPDGALAADRITIGKDGFVPPQ